MDEIKKLPAVTTTVTLECAGNGRAFFQPAVAGIQWEKGAVSTARFTGARMSDVLKKAGVKTAGINVEMHAADRPPGTMPAFVRQVPMAKAMHPDTIIAYDMNGQPIPLVHGAPLRAIIPGWEGAYSVKWLNALNVLAKDSDSFWVATGYRYPTRRVAPGAAVDAKDMAPLTGLVVKSLITTPANGASQAVGKVDGRRICVGRRGRHQGRGRLDRQRRHLAAGATDGRTGTVYLAGDSSSSSTRRGRSRI